MRNFDFLEAHTVKEASQILDYYGDRCRLMAGGTALMLVLRQRMLAADYLVSIARIDAMKGIHFDPGTGLRIGALSRHIDVAKSPLVQQHYPMLAAMARQVANPQVRNQGTLGGNLCYADPQTDPSSCLLALGASVVLTSQRGERVLGLPDFLLDYYATALEPDEVLTAITVPPPVDGQAGLYLRHLRTAAEHRPLCNLALSVRNEDGICRAASLVVGASTPVPARLPKTEALMLGNAMTPELARVVSDSAAGEMSALDDSRASESFRRQVAAVMARRAISSLFGVTLDQGEM